MEGEESEAEARMGSFQSQGREGGWGIWRKQEVKVGD